ncbi:MAG TPA: hypothetical protein EYN66_23095, partial [Myxococcales bacterium]|nr:hypothetical protein [Myxococcales bacterium]
MKLNGFSPVLLALLCIITLNCSGQRGMIGKKNNRPAPGNTHKPANQGADFENSTPSNESNPETGNTQQSEDEEGQSNLCNHHQDCPDEHHCSFDPAQHWSPDLNGQCIPNCITVDNCPEIGQICHSGICYNDYECENNTQCPPGSVCRRGQCSPPPEQCRFDKDCPVDWHCNNYNQCAPRTSSDPQSNPSPNNPSDPDTCYNHEDCPNDQYCDTFTGKCEDGCRVDTDCIGMCPGSATCGCNSTHTCSADEILEPDQDCSLDDALCPAGTLCAPTPEAVGTMPCALDGLSEMGGGSMGALFGAMCPKTCRMRCDLAMETMSGISSCPANEICQQP